MHVPPRAATIGFAFASMARINVLSAGSANVFGVLNSRMSAPAENALPAPVITMPTTRSSAFARSIAASSSLRTACPSPFTGGLENVITATRS